MGTGGGFRGSGREGRDTCWRTRREGCEIEGIMMVLQYPSNPNLRLRLDFIISCLCVTNKCHQKYKINIVGQKTIDNFILFSTSYILSRPATHQLP